MNNLKFFWTLIYFSFFKNLEGFKYLIYSILPYDVHIIFHSLIISIRFYRTANLRRLGQWWSFIYVNSNSTTPAKPILLMHTGLNPLINRNSEKNYLKISQNSINYRTVWKTTRPISQHDLIYNARKLP